MRKRLRLYESIFEYSNAGIVVHDGNQRVIAVNPEFCRINGYSAEEVIGGHASAILASALPGERASDEVRRERIEALNSVGQWRGQMWARRKDGTDYPRWMSVARIPGDVRSAFYTISSSVDITELVQRERELRESEQRLRLYESIFDHTNAAIILQDDDHRIIAANPAFCRRMGYPLAEVIGQDSSFVASPLNSEERLGEFWTAMQEKGEWDGKLWARRKDGTDFPRWVSVARIPGDANSPSYHISSSVDISELDRTERELRERETQLQLMGTFFELSGSAFVLTDAENRILAVNQAFTSMTGYGRDEAVGRDPSFLWPADPALRERDDARDRNISATGYWRGECWVQRKDGSLFPRMMIVTENRDEQGKVINRIGSFTDITEEKQRELELHDTAERLRLLGAVFEHAGEAMTVTNSEDKLLAVNTAFTKITGYTAEEALGRVTAFLRAEEAPEDYPNRMRSVEAQGYWQGETRGRRKDGTIYPRWLVLAAIRDAEGKMTHRVGAFTDISGEKQLEAQLRMLGNAFEQCGEAIAVTDAEKRFVTINQSFTRLTGYTLDEIRGMSPEFLAVGPSALVERKDVIDQLDRAGHWHGESRARRKDGTEFPQWMSLSVVRDAKGPITHYVTSFTDISERKQAEQRIHDLAHHDSLTGLPNRLSLHGRLEQAISSARRSGEMIAVMFLDMDRFKSINDSLGHDVGDGLLIEVGRRLTLNVRDSDIVARLGGDEFVVVLTGLSGVDRLARQAEKMVRDLGRAYDIQGHRLHSTPSIGIGIFPADGDSVAELMRNADVAMYHAKSDGRNTFRFFAASMNQAATERLALENGMREALALNQFTMHYQAQIEVSTGRAIGFEALMRWNDPENGMVPPGKFIPVAEETGLINKLGLFALRDSLRQLREWRDQGHPTGRMAVNLSAHQLRSEDFPGLVAEALAEFRIVPSDLEFEVTESVAMKNPQATIAILDQLREIGVQLAIDDFGTGYSSLSYLKLLPIQRLKLDASFVRDIESDPNDAAICTATIALAHSLGLEVVAEGVETEAQFDFMKRLGCDIVQGYYFSRPAPAGQVRQFLSREARPGT